MEKEKAIIGFIGAGGIARSHAYSLNSLCYYYNNAPDFELEAVCSATSESRENFAGKYGFKRSCSLDEFIADRKINTVFILGPNKVHYEHLKSVVENMPSVKSIYLEKPVCSGTDEEIAIAGLLKDNQSIVIQVGYQFLLSAAIRQLILFWKSGQLGKPVHFDLKYYHSDYINKEYRDKRRSRLTPAPDGGAMADLGSHSISLLIALLGEKLTIAGALQSGNYNDVSDDSDLFSLISIYDPASGAAGTVSASRISTGTGDYFSLEMYAEEGSLRYSSDTPDGFDFYTRKSGMWSRQFAGSSYSPYSSFPSGHVPPGWLRSMIHAHYVFLTGNDQEAFIPDIRHGLAVQRLVTRTADHLRAFRNAISNEVRS
jgi:predicted dehydrogenase